MKRLISVLLVLFLFVCFAIPVFASGSGDTAFNIWDLPANVYQAVKNMFVPHKDYFHNSLQELNNLINSRFGNFGHFYIMLNYFFKELQHPSLANFNLSIPDNHFYPGYLGLSFNILSASKPYIYTFRSAISGFACIVTAIACYHKIRVFFSE